MKEERLLPAPPLDGPAVLKIETALHSSPGKTIRIEINSTLYQISREGRWFKLSLLTKKKTIKRATIFETISEIYNQVIHGNAWRIAEITI